VDWISGHRSEKQKHVSVLIVAVVTGRIAPGLKTTNYTGPALSAFFFQQREYQDFKGMKYQQIVDFKKRRQDLSVPLFNRNSGICGRNITVSYMC
jgi:uncharacterized protein with von Willebrand factor type A (vWA) domain